MATADSKKAMEAAIATESAKAQFKFQLGSQDKAIAEMRERFILYWHHNGNITEVGRSDMKSLDKKLEQLGRQYKHGHIRHRYIGASRYSRDSATSGKF